MNRNPFIAALQTEVTLPDFRFWTGQVLSRMARAVGLPCQYVSKAELEAGRVTAAPGALCLLEYTPDEILGFDLLCAQAGRFRHRTGPE